MGVINIKAIFDWLSIQTGLQNMKGQFQRVGAEVDKGFSVGSLARNFLGGFIGVNLATKLVEPFKQAAGYAERIAQATANLRDLTLGGIQQRNTPERNLPVMEREMRANDSRLAGIESALGNLADFSDPLAVVKNPRLLNPFIYEADKGQYDSLVAERDQLRERNQGLLNDRNEANRNIANTRRQLGYETGGIYDRREVMRGGMSQVEALERAAQRAGDEYAHILKTRGLGNETTSAFNTYVQAQNAAEQARAAFEKDRINGVIPQISSSSLAQLGGGGNVNVFGGRAGEGISELREHTRLLREISTKVGTASSASIVAP